MIEEGKKYLITTEKWFYHTDGNLYRAVYGTASMFEAKKLLGFNPTRSANWYVRIGSDENYMLIAGCQINYAQRTDDSPTIQSGKYTDKESGRDFQNNAILVLD